jgi:hypothetical protein
VAKPRWQHDPHCPGRTVADVSSVALNVAVYEPDYAKSGWLPVGGTSAASPLIAGIYALAGNATKIQPGYEYAHASPFFDITTGNDDWESGGGKSCGYDYLCVAKPGYDAPTGLGTPDGTGVSRPRIPSGPARAPLGMRAGPATTAMVPRMRRGSGQPPDLARGTARPR